MNDTEVKTYMCNNRISTIDLSFTNALNRTYNPAIPKTHRTKHRLATVTIKMKKSLKEGMDNTIVNINPEILSNEVLKNDPDQTCDVVNHPLICALTSSRVSRWRKSKSWFDKNFINYMSNRDSTKKIGKLEYSEPESICINEKSFPATMPK